MPGILGIFSKNNSDNPLMNDMFKTLKHKNWYKINKYKNEFCCLGRIHLNIFNPESQPIFSKDRSLCIFMDGKIYDYSSEKNKLKDKGYKFQTNSDAEFCLFLYEENGVDFVKKINGTFVIIILDIKKEKITIFNDRYGLRPHYYSKIKNKLLFAPEVKAILCNKEIKKELDYEAIIDFFAIGRMVENKTFHKEIKLLPPASILTFSENKLTLSQYWDVEYNPNYNVTEKEFINQLNEKFKKAVKITMGDHFQYGISLSGGLDSRLIVAAINKNKRKNITSFSFGIKNCDEIKIAKKIAQKAGTKFKSIEIKPETILANAEKTVCLVDGMNYMGMSYIMPVHNIIKNTIQIVLDGFFLDVTLGGSYLNKKIMNFNNNIDFLNYYYKKQRLFSDEELNNLFVKKFGQKEKSYLLQSLKKRLKKINVKHPGNKSDYFIIKEHGRRGTAVGYAPLRAVLENSVPTYDNELIDLILTIPPELRMNHYIYRKFLKKISPTLAKIPYNKTMISPALPYIFWRISSILYYYKTKIEDEIIYSLKKNISVFPERNYINFSKWLYLNDDWKKYFTELLLNKNSLLQKYLNQSFIKKLLESHGAKSGFLKRIDNSKKILYLATFEHLLRYLKE